MMDYDVFNGDADGICGILQLRLHSPRKSTLITGVKRDVQLLEQVDSARNITVVDIAMSANTEPLQRLLDAGSRVEWFDHHFAGNIPEHSNLTPHIDTSPEVCSSVIIDKALGGTFRHWAVVAAFGDNLIATAKTLAKSLAAKENIEKGEYITVDKVVVRSPGSGLKRSRIEALVGKRAKRSIVAGDLFYD